LRLFLLVLCLTPAGFAQQQTPGWEIFGGYSFERSVVREYYKSTPIIYTFREDYTNLNGWELSVTENVNRRFGGTFQATGHYKTPEFRGTRSRQNLFSIMYGPRFTQRAGWVTLYEHVLFGANHTSVVVSPGPHASEWAFAAAGGLGVDVNMGSKAAVRVLQVQYSPMNPIVSREHKFQASAGLVFHLGKINK
jgi:hypothetical protein